MITEYKSPVNQDFVWLAEYMNGTELCEYDVLTKDENSFYSIQRENLLRFGLFGHGMKMYYEVFGGIFKIAGQMIEVIYKVGDKEYYLTGQQAMYKDIITYKNAEATINLFDGKGGMNSNITQFNFGYKTTLDIDGVQFNFKAITSIPFGNPSYMTFWLVADQELEGKLQIKKNGRVIEEIDAPLSKDVGGELNWTIN